MALGPVVSGSSLAKDKVIRAEELAERSGTDGVHGTRLQIHEDGTGNIAAASGLVEVDIDALQLEIRVAVVRTGGVDSVFVRNDFPEFCTNLVTALTGLDMDDFSH